MLQKITDHLTKKKWQSLAEKAKQGERLAGFFHENYIYTVGGQDCLFRFVLANAAQMNPVAFDEVDVLGVLTEMNVPCPKLIYKSHDKSFYVEEAIRGQTMEMKYPPRRSCTREIL
jgi:fructosamine-3-kinase